MSNVVLWPLAGSLAVFGLGLVSAIETRRQRTKRTTRERPPVEEILTSEQVVRMSVSAPRRRESSTAMSMAAGGTGNVSLGAFNGNAEENLASIGSNSR